MSNRSPGAHSAAELNIKESSKAGMNGDATIGRHRRLITKLRRIRGFIPSKQMSNSVTPLATSQLLGSHLLLLFAVHGPYGHQAHSLPKICTPEATADRDSVEVKQAKRSFNS